MKQSQVYEWAITPLAPLHIGCGQVYEPTNYVVKEAQLHEFDSATLAEVLQPKDREELLRIVNRRGSTQMILAVQEFFASRGAKIVSHALQAVPLSVAVTDLYRTRIGRVAADQGEDRKIFNRLAIDRTAYLPQNRAPYLPGSSIKGAIRTALLHAINRGRPAEEDERKDIRNGGLHTLQGRLLDYRSNQRLVLEKDPLRQLRIGDGVGASSVARRVYLAVNRPKVVRTARQSDRPQQERSGSPDQYLECVLPQARAFASQVEVQDLRGALGASASRLAEKLPSSSFSMSKIAAACTAFYRPMLEQEIRQMQEQELLDTSWAQNVQKLLETLRARMDAGEVFLLRVGRHSGAESMTLPGMRQIKILRGRGVQPETKDQATTWWLGAELEKNQKTGLLPFGWLLVEVRPWQAQETGWSTTAPVISWQAPQAEPEAAEEAVAAEAVLSGVRKLKYDRRNGAITAETAQGPVTAIRPESDALLQELPEKIRNQLRDGQCFGKFTVTVRGRALIAVQPE